MELSMSNVVFERGVMVRVHKGTYEGAVGEIIGPRLGGDVAIAVVDACGHDLHEGETLCVGEDEVSLEGPFA